MKTLPDSPSLDHLRQQAKDLLPQLRTVRPGASLSDAQAQLFRSLCFLLSGASTQDVPAKEH